MDTIHLYYVRGLREFGSARADERVLQVVDNINRQYECVGVEREGVPYQIVVEDLDELLNGLSNDELEDITGQKGSSHDLIDLIQTPTSFEEALSRASVVHKDGEWYRGDERLTRVQLTSTPIQSESRFQREFDVRKRAETHFGSNYKIILMWAKLLNTPPQPREEYIQKRMDKEYASYLQTVLKDFSAQTSETDLSILEGLANEALGRAYLLGDTRISEYLGRLKNSMDSMDKCMLYINSIKEPETRQTEFARFNHIVANGLMEGENDYVRVLPAPGYESQVGDYPYIDNLCRIIKERLTDGDKIFILLDRYQPKIFIGKREPKPYLLLRHPNDSNIGSAGDRETLTVKGLQFLLLHELAHQIADGYDIQEFDHPLETRLMIAPTHYSNFNRGKLSDESVREVYRVVK